VNTEGANFKLVSFLDHPVLSLLQETYVKQCQETNLHETKSYFHV